MAYESQLKYVGSDGTEVSLDGRRTWSGTFLGLRGRKWSYELGRKSVSSQARTARAETVSVDWFDLSEADRARGVMDADMQSGAPGLLVSGEWSQRSLVVEEKPTARFRGWMKSDVTFLLLDGAWSKEHAFRFLPSGNVSDYGKSYAYGYPYDYAPSSPARTVDVPGSVPSPFRLVIFGRAVQPSITIGGNVYSFGVTVPAGGYLLVDTLRDPVVELVTADGIRTDAFESAHRGGGLGSGAYAFEPIAPGSQLVSWDDSFGFDLITYQLEGEIPWKLPTS